MKNIVMIGPQGSGKGTQSELLALKLNIPHISLGTLFRAEVAKKSDIGQEVAGYMARGEIVPIDVANKVITGRLSMPDAGHGVILDGYPRTLEQADALENIFRQLDRPLTHVVYLNVADEEALNRLSGRRVCSNTSCEQNYHVTLNPPKKDPAKCDACGAALIQRPDDVPDAIRRRLEIYHSETTPLISLYKGQGVLHEIDGQRPIGEVQSSVRSACGA
jgi:adenylate kinase